MRSAYKSLGGKFKLMWQVIRDRSVKFVGLGWINLDPDEVQWGSSVSMVNHIDFYNIRKFLDFIHYL